MIHCRGSKRAREKFIFFFSMASSSTKKAVGDDGGAIAAVSGLVGATAAISLLGDGTR